MIKETELEEKTMKEYPLDVSEGSGIYPRLYLRAAFKKGYRQCEEDNEGKVDWLMFAYGFGCMLIISVVWHIAYTLS